MIGNLLHQIAAAIHLYEIGGARNLPGLIHFINQTCEHITDIIRTRK